MMAHISVSGVVKTTTYTKILTILDTALKNVLSDIKNMDLSERRLPLHVDYSTVLNTDY